MLTRFITSQHDHDGCLCMGINRLPNLTGELTSPSLLPLAGQTLVNLASETTPPCLFSLSLPVVSPQAPPLHSPLSRWSTNGNRDQLSQHYNPCQNLAPRRRAFKTYSLWRGFSFQPTRRPNSVDMDSNTTEGEPVAEGLPEAANAIGDSRQNDRDGSTLTTANS